MIKLTDYICARLTEFGVRDVFMISGGGAMHLVDSVGKQPKLNYICPHHEQAAAIAAEGYARVSGKMGVVVVTSGPGGTNTLTGVIGQWLDSVPCLYISGQVKYETTIAACPEIELRQLGDQEINIIDIVKPVTKYAVSIKDPKTIKYHLEKAVYLATHGRPGPAWLDVPLDIQAAMIDETALLNYDQTEDEIKFDGKLLKEQVSQVVELLKKAKRPVIIPGNGVRLAGAQQVLAEVLSRLKSPVVSTFNGFDLMADNDPLFIGRIGTIGTRAGNFALQNADLTIFIGTRNNIRQISYNWQTYARSAAKVVVDIDPAELKKPTVKPDLAINADAKLFLDKLFESLKAAALPKYQQWLKWCQERKQCYPVVLPGYKENKQLVQPYYFVKTLTENLDRNGVVVAGNGTACVVLFQAGVVKPGQRMFWNSGCASMGYDLPAAIGACLGAGKKDVVCLAGDGSLQMNIQELQTMFYHKLPLKLFVLNNCGYISIRQTQDAFFKGRRVACCEQSGVSCPDTVKIAKAYGLSAVVIDSHTDLAKKVKEVLSTKGPVVCEVVLSPEYKFAPKLSSEKRPDGTMVSKPLEDMFPFLDRQEFEQNMIREGYDE